MLETVNDIFDVSMMINYIPNGFSAQSIYDKYILYTHLCDKYMLVLQLIGTSLLFLQQYLYNLIVKNFS